MELDLLVRCRFNMMTNIIGLVEKKYKFMDFGGKFAKIKDIYKDGEYTKIFLESRHVRKKFVMIIETVWRIKDKMKTFEPLSAVVSIDIFGVDWQIFVIPDSHKNSLQKWYESK